MLKPYVHVSETGELIEFVVADPEGPIPDDYVSPWTERFFKPIYDFQQEKWVEGLSVEEVKMAEESIQQEQNHHKTSEEERILKLEKENLNTMMALTSVYEMMLGGSS